MAIWKSARLAQSQSRQQDSGSIVGNPETIPAAFGVFLQLNEWVTVMESPFHLQPLDSLFIEMGLGGF